MLSFNHAHTTQTPFSRKASVRRMLMLLLAFIGLAVVAGAQQSRVLYRQAVLEIQQYIQSNDLDDARASLATALKRYPSDGGLENLLGVVEIQQGHFELAEAEFSKAIQHSPKLVSAYLNLGRLYMQTASGDPHRQGEALHLYQKVVEMAPANAEANFQEATLFLAQHMYQRSLESLATLDAKAHLEARVQALVCADEAALGHKRAAARAAALMVASPDLTEQDAMTTLPALQAAHRADLVDALFSAAGARQPLSITGLHYLGLAQEAEGKSEQARATLERMFALDGSSVTPLVDLARIASNSKDYRAALGYLAHARALQPNDANLSYEFGIICLRMNLIGAARRAFGEAVRLAPDNSEYNLALGTLLSSAAGLPYLKKYQELHPEDAAGALALGAAYFEANDFGNSSIWLTKATSSASTAAPALYYLGKILLQQGRYDEAIAQLSKSAALKPDQPDVLAELGEVHMQMGKYSQAEKDIDRAIALDNDNYAANFALVRLYAHTKDPRQEQQTRRFETLRNKDEEQYRDMMRIVEARPQGGPASDH